jgi:hypothetical protein
MNIPQKVITIIESLLKKTMDGAYNWYDSSSYYRYSVTVGKGSILVDYDSIANEEFDTSYDAYYVLLLNSEAKEIDRFEQITGDEHFELLRKLHTAARRNALNAEGTYDDFLGELGVD